jgi:hypothetical protein
VPGRDSREFGVLGASDRGTRTRVCCVGVWVGVISPSHFSPQLFCLAVREGLERVKTLFFHKLKPNNCVHLPLLLQ